MFVFFKTSPCSVTSIIREKNIQVLHYKNLPQKKLKFIILGYSREKKKLLCNEAGVYPGGEFVRNRPPTPCNIYFLNSFRFELFFTC